MADLKEVYLKDNDLIKVNGRTIESRDPAYLLWSGSSIEMKVKCSELYVLMEGPYDTYENRIAIEINGSIISRQAVSKEKEWVNIFRMNNPENETTVRIIKEVQLMSDDPCHSLNIYAVKLDGEILPVNEKKLKIEFIGDSITSGEGAIGARCEQDWVSRIFSHTRSYPYLVGKMLDADIRVFSQSGWGVYHSWDNKPFCTIPKYYEETASLLKGDIFKEKGFHDKWDFKKWQPDFIIINLGTNDDGAFHNDEFKDPETGEVHKLKMNGDEYDKDDLKKVRKAMTKFIKKVRKNNPDACIIWTYGLVGNAMAPVIKKAIKKSEDTNTFYVGLQEVTDDTVGSRCHPGKKAHKKTAKKLVFFIKGYLY